ncbi:hypothetical protein Tco_0590465 [Tanacetum coccineum]
MSSNDLFSCSSSSSFRQSSASKIDQLYEISYVPNDSRIPVKHLVSLSLLSDLPHHCLAQGYTHIHFGTIRLALTFHGRKGLPAYSQIALLDTRFVEYQHAYVDSNATPTCTYVPKQLSKDELVKLLPEKWITNYEQIHRAHVRSTSALEFVRHENGLVEMKFSSSQPNCLDEAAKIDDDEDLPKKRKSWQQKLKRRYEKGDPTVGLLGESSGKFDYYVLYPKAEPSQPPSPPP